MSTTVQKGLDIKISIIENKQRKTLAGQRGATLNRSAEVIDVTNKISGGWKENIPSVKEWSVDCDGVFVIDDAALKLLETAFNESKEVIVELFDGTNWGYKGNAIITDFPIEAPYDDAVTYSLTLQGSGALEESTASLE